MGGLIGSPNDILNPENVRALLEATMLEATDALDIRARAVSVLKQANIEEIGRASCRERV